jgi:hypothetical protein
MQILPPVSKARSASGREVCPLTTFTRAVPLLTTVCLLLTACGTTAVPGGTRPATLDTETKALTVSTTPLSLPAGFMTSVKTYGAVGDGVTDDTAAIQAALADGRSSTTQDYYGLPKALYFPPGTYLVHDTLEWVGCCVTLQGAGPGASVIRLEPAAAGFGDSTQPKPLILTPNISGNESFRQNIWDLGFSIGPDNPGATALNYISNNTGSIHDVVITSEDGKAYSGIDLTRKYSGPLMIRDTAIQGFDVGIDLANAEYSATMENISLKGQSVAGIRDLNQPISILGLTSVNTVPAVTNNNGFVVLIDGTLTGGTSANPALQTNNTMYLRNITSSGYKQTLSSTMSGYPAALTGSISQHLVGNPMTLTGNVADGSLGLTINPTPSFVSSSLSDWAAFVPRWYGDTAGLQTLMNGGKHTIYFPFEPYLAYNEADVTVPDSVDRIVGFSSIINSSSSGTNGGGIRLIVTSNSTTPLVVEQFGYGMKIDHRGSRPVVIKNGKYTYYSSPGAGNLYLEDVDIEGFTIQKGQQVWARQLDDEVNSTKITNAGSLWLLGMKTERPGTVINTTAGGKTELLGALIYPSQSVPSSNVAFQSTDAQVSYMYSEQAYCTGCGYAIQIKETRSGTSKQITSSANTGWRLPLFVGYQQ